MNLPEEIKIGNRTIQVSVESISDDLFGFFDPETQRIVIADNIQNADLFMETFFHELIHAINDFIRFDHALIKELNDSDTPAEDAFNFNEFHAENFSKVFLQVIKDNSLLFS